MAYYQNFASSNNPEEEGKMAWDLRQVFAKDIVGVTLKRIQDARVSENYPVWFHLLKRDLATEIFKNLEEEQNKLIENKIEETIKIINKNKLAYQRKSSIPEEHENIENALTQLEKLMLSFMQMNGMFGTKDFEDDGL